MSINQGGKPKVTINDNKKITEISIANPKNEITYIMYKNKIELYGKKLPVGFLQTNIDEVAKKNLLKDIKITTLIS